MISELWLHFKYFIADFSFYLVLIFTALLMSTAALLNILKTSYSQKKKKILATAVFCVLIFILMLSVFEAYFRYVYDESDGLGFLKVNERWHKRHVIHNNYFFRDRDFDIIKEEGIIRIGVLGDSIAFGGGIKEVKNRFSNILEDNLRNATFRVEVYNLGIPGADTDLEIERYESIKHLKFDILVWEYFLNDIQRLGKSTGTPIIVNNSKQGQIAQFLSKKSLLFDFTYWRISSRYNRTLGELRTADLERYKDENQLAVHKEMIGEFLDKLDQDKTKVVVIIFPFLYFLGPDYQARDVHKLMGDHFRGNGVEVIDMLQYLENYEGRSLWASEFDSHPNEFVHKIAGVKLYEKIVPILTQAKQVN